MIEANLLDTTPDRFTDTSGKRFHRKGFKHHNKPQTKPSYDFTITQTNHQRHTQRQMERLERQALEQSQNRHTDDELLG